MELEGRVALVTGASGGIGGAIALGLARAGASVACHYLSDPSAAQGVVAEIGALGGQAFSVAADVRDPSHASRMVADVVARYGRLDILVNNAGVMNTTNLLELTEGEWDAVLDTNLKGYFLVGQSAARTMVGQRYGRILNVSSTRQEQAWPGSLAYASAKGGIWMLTRVMALELGPYGIRVNSIAPGTIATDLNRSYLSDPEFRQRRISTIPVGRLGLPEDVVAAAVLLASEQADFINGASLMIDGGQTIW